MFGFGTSSCRTPEKQHYVRRNPKTGPTSVATGACPPSSFPRKPIAQSRRPSTDSSTTLNSHRSSIDSRATSQSQRPSVSSYASHESCEYQGSGKSSYDRRSSYDSRRSYGSRRTSQAYAESSVSADIADIQLVHDHPKLAELHPCPNIEGKFCESLLG